MELTRRLHKEARHGRCLNPSARRTGSKTRLLQAIKGKPA
jgi:hypothetical protein